MLHTGAAPFLGHNLIWRAWAPLKVKIFLWLALRRRHWTADRRRRHGLEAQDRCHLCDQSPESIDHVLALCPYSRKVWFLVLQAMGVQLSPSSATTLQWRHRIRSAATGPRKKGLDTLFALVSWQLWKERNARLFWSSAATIAEILQLIKAEADLWIAAGARGLQSLAQQS